MHRYYKKGAVFERKIIHNLIGMGALLAMRGAGSKSAGSIKADIMALFPSGYLVIIQAKTSKRRSGRLSMISAQRNGLGGAVGCLMPMCR